jgi:enterochelin esterase-like enzyme
MRFAAVAALAAWLAVGLVGVSSYGRDYYSYRGFPPPRHPVGVAPGKLVSERFYSPALGRNRSYTIVLPPGYAAAAARGQRFPVFYMLHGTSGSPALMIGAGGVQVRLDSLLASGTVRPFLIVLPDGRDGSLLSDTEWANTSHGNYEGFVLDTVRAVDQRWSTIQSPAARAIGGLSEGAYGAVNITLRHPGLFSVVESWSGYFKQNTSGPFRNATASALNANSPTAYLGSLGAGVRRERLHVFLYAGRHDPARPKLAPFAGSLSAAGADVQTAIYPGHHDWRLWRGQMTNMLRYAGAHLGSGR